MINGSLQLCGGEKACRVLVMYGYHRVIPTSSGGSWLTFTVCEPRCDSPTRRAGTRDGSDAPLLQAHKRMNGEGKPSCNVVPRVALARRCSSTSTCETFVSTPRSSRDGPVQSCVIHGVNRPCQEGLHQQKLPARIDVVRPPFIRSKRFAAHSASTHELAMRPKNGTS
jgi:hypothetical protein